MNKLPVQISPNPLVSSVVEVRFSSEIKTEEIVEKFFPILGNDYSFVTYSEVPQLLKKADLNYKNTPDFIFSNQRYSISIGTNIISFENIDTYHLWHSYFGVIKDVIGKVNQLDIIQRIDRVGLRYISLFDPKYKFTEIMKHNYMMNYKEFIQSNDLFQTELSKENIKLVLKIAENGIVTKGGQIYRGLFVDIDASQITDLPLHFNENLLNIIDKLHLEEKKLFYSLLTEQFIASLNPKY